ncbi:MAG: T9SS type A sorting domain-containing protein, partial [Deltaproteobacteria bacterium]|nr:T9SS type A sorting domain-containing protein [Deltaproteobacteria bacterium]
MKLKKLILIFFTIVFLPTVLFSKQPGDFTIFGVVTDSISNLPMADVFVEVINEADTTERSAALIDSSGNYSINLTVTDIHKSIDELPAEFSLNQNYPNPFNPSTIIGFQLPKVSDVQLVIYNILGQRIKTLVKQKLTAGVYTAIWDGTNDTGAGVAAGIYFYRFTADPSTGSPKGQAGHAFVETKKMILLDGSSGGLSNLSSSGVQNGNVTRHLAKSKNMQVTIRATSLLIHTFE